MTKILKAIVMFLAKIHNEVYAFCYVHFGLVNDKMLHFLILGITGMALVIVLKPLCGWLVKRHKTITLTFIYVFTCMVVLTFAIEIGQKITNTGNMEFGDIAAGLSGFLSMFLVYVILVMIWRAITKKKA